MYGNIMAVARYMTFIYPEGLLLGLLLGYLFFRFKHKNAWRWMMLICAIALLGYPAFVLRSKSLEIFLVADRSRSISDEAREKELEIIDLVSQNLEPGDRFGIISFKDRAYIEQIPQSEGAISSFKNPYSEDASDLSEGLRTALSLSSTERQSRILLLSDGEYTGQDPLREAHLARQMEIPIDYRNLKRAALFNLMVSDMITPDKILVNEPFRLKFTISATVDTPGRYRIYRNEKIIGGGKGGWRDYNFNAGENELTFVETLDSPSVYSYRIEIESIPREKENVLRDNVAEKYIKVVGERPTLVINNDGNPDNVTSVLSAGNIPVHIVGIENFRMNLNQLEGYKGIILNNVPLLTLSRKQIIAVRDFVLEEGGGLLVTGGDRSFAQGGYYKSPLEPVLPVSLEDRKQSKKISTALSVVIDRSGSMQVAVPSGETKISLANNAVVECLNLLAPGDSISVIAVDSQPHVILPQQPVSDPEYLSREILQIESMGGGIFVYDGLAAATQEILKAPHLNKHILLFADANDSEQPGQYKSLLQKATEAGMTFSVVGLGTEYDQDAEFLKDIASRGNGEIYFTNDAKQLPQFFTADTLNFIRQSFLEEPAPMDVRASAYVLSPDQQWDDFTCGGYNLLFSRPDADVAIITADEDAAPVLAFWQRGLGRAASLALYTEGPFAANKQSSDIVLSTSRWIMGSNVFDNLQIRTSYEGQYARITMEVAPEERENITAPEAIIFTPGDSAIKLPMTWESYDRLAATVRLEEQGYYNGVIKAGDKVYKIGPLSMPVSPEFKRDRNPEFGKRTMEEIASISGGKEIINIEELFQRSEKSLSRSPLLTPFLVAFLALFVIDVAESRFGLQAAIFHAFKGGRRRISEFKKRKQKMASEKTFRGKPRKRKKSVKEEISHDETKTVKTEKETKKQEDISDMDYLSEAKAEVKKRFKKRRDDKEE